MSSTARRSVTVLRPPTLPGGVADPRCLPTPPAGVELAVDLGGVRLIDSTLAGWLLTCREISGRTVILRGCARQVREQLRRLGFHRLFELHPDTDPIAT